MSHFGDTDSRRVQKIKSPVHSVCLLFISMNVKTFRRNYEIFQVLWNFTVNNCLHQNTLIVTVVCIREVIQFTCDIMCAKKKASFALWLVICFNFERRKMFIKTVL